MGLPTHQTPAGKRKSHAPSITDPLLLQEAMRNLGYHFKVLPSGAFGFPTYGIEFEGHGTTLHFDDWSDVSAFITASLEEEMDSWRDHGNSFMTRIAILPAKPQDKRRSAAHEEQIAAMEQLGLDLIADYTDEDRTDHFVRYVFFKGAHGSISFRSWGEVDAYLTTHTSPEDIEVIQSTDVPKPGIK